MSTEAGSAALVRQLAALGWSEAAIAAATQMSVEQVALALGASAPHQRPQINSAAADSAARATTRAGGDGICPAVVAHQGAKTAEDFGRATFVRLAKQRARLQAEAALLRAEIERLIAADPGPARGRAQRIQPKLEHPRSLRTVQWHLKVIAQRRV